ncbi:MAG: hypothetical protein A3K19_16745 [Lentisphaerae bacterium RIFOXYB12_FULL_65_16]|nr:MAG: hypothetical protein A3K18_26665 [Lentisphaerae bacterium RIFOXYA12_64_32]OGV88969.1 MAG: hypothetical protein A3K19_16745 [Lentisphaerae bacterium RIFOXYB12_FULL_65_16]
MPELPELPANARIGVIAGRGDLPLLVCREARHANVPYLGVLAMQNDTRPEIESLADHVDWVYPGQLSKAIRCLKRQDIRHVICVGQIKPGRLFTGIRPDLRALLLLSRLRERNAQTLFTAVADELERHDIHVLPSTVLMRNHLATPGVLGRVRPSRSQRLDIELGLRVARETSRLNIGQTVVIKHGTVLAVEAFEGTDKAIRRGGELGHGGVTVVKVAMDFHDMRFDVPCIGMGTVESLLAAQAKVLAVQAHKTLLLDREAVLDACNRARIAVVGIEIPPPDAA